MLKIFDRKGDYQSLLHYPKFVYLQLMHFFINIIEPPPGLDFKRWVNIIAEIFSNYLDIRVASRSLLVTTILKISELPEFLPSGRYPTLKDVYFYLLKMKIPLLSNISRQKETLIIRLEGLFAVFGDNINSHRQLNWNKFIKTDWALSLVGLPTDYQNLLILIIVSKVLMYRIVNNLRSQNLENLVVLDEASTMLKIWHEQREGNYLLLDYLAQAREFGVGFLISTQTLSTLPTSLLANTGIKVIVGGSGSGTDYDIFASATGITPEQKTYLKQLTNPGQACVKDPRYPHVFTLKVPHIVE